MYVLVYNRWAVEREYICTYRREVDGRGEDGNRHVK